MESTCLFQEFEPKPGYILENILCCSYGFNPDLFLTLLFYSLGEADEDFSSGALKSEAKEKIKTVLSENLKKCLIVAAREAPIAEDSAGTIQLALLDRLCSVKAASDTKGTFHPKIILAIYKDEKGKRYGRFYTGSKNITTGTASEFGAVWEISSGNNGEGISSILVSLAAEPGMGAREKAYLSSLKSKVKELKLPDGVSIQLQSRVHQVSCVKDNIKDLVKNAKKIHIHSPWVGEGAIDELKKHIPASCKINLKMLPLKNNLQVIENHQDINVVLDSRLTEKNKFHSGNSHAKILLIENERGVMKLLFGSPYFTNRGVGVRLKNTELFALMPKVGSEYNFLKIGKTVMVDVEGQDVDLTDTERKKKELLDSIFVSEVQYEKRMKELVYFIEVAPKFNVKVRHYLIEEFGNKKYIEFELNKDTKLISVPCDIPLSHISRYMTFHVKFNGNEMRSDQNVHLSDGFYEARVNLATFDYFKLTRVDIIEAFYDILDFPSPLDTSNRKKGNGVSAGSPINYDFLLEQYPLDRLAVKLIKARHSNSEVYTRKLKRIKGLIEDLEKEKEPLIVSFLDNLRLVVNEAKR
jgi:hypothetical protein